MGWDWSGQQERCRLTIYNCAHLRQILRFRMDLCICNCDLECSSSSKANEDLISDPFSSRSASIKGIHQPCTYRCNRTTNDPEKRHDADFRQCKALDDGGESQRDDQSEHSNARVDGGGRVDGLEVDGEVVEEDEVGAAEEEHVEGAYPDVAF